MKKSNIIMTALGAASVYAGRRVVRGITSAVTDRTSTILINSTLRRYHISNELYVWMVGSPLISNVANGIFGEKFKYYKRSWVEPNWVGPIISIAGVVCYLGGGTKLDNRALYVPRLGYSKVEAVLIAAMEEIETPKKMDYQPGAKFTARIDEDTVVWDGSSRKRPVFLDDIPIGSNTRTTLRSHIDRVLHEWDSGDITYSRNLLLYGPKGGGKSHIAMATANELRAAISIMPTAKNADSFTRMMEEMSGRHCVVLVDEAESLPIFCPGYVPRSDTGMTTRDMLDYFAGIGSPLSTMTLLCTNDPDKIDERFRRKGRFKEEILIDKVDSDGIKYWLKKKYDYTAPEAVRLRPTMCADLFDMIDTLDDPEALVRHLTIRPRTRKPKANPTPK